MGPERTAGKPHPTTFVQSSDERATTKVARAQAGKLLRRHASGIENLVIYEDGGFGI